MTDPPAAAAVGVAVQPWGSAVGVAVQPWGSAAVRGPALLDALHGATPLTAETAASVAAPAVPPVRLRLCQTGITVLNLAVTLAVFGISLSAPVVCTEAEPCAPHPLAYAGLGALMAACFVAWIDVWAAAIAVSVFAASLIWFYPPGTH